MDRLGQADRLAWSAAGVTALASLGGLSIAGLYRDHQALIQVTRADDSFRLIVLLPILAIGLLGAARGSMLGRLASMAALACLAYLYAFVAAAAAVNPMSLAQVAALGLTFWALVLSFDGLDPARVEAAVGGRLLRRTTAVFLLAMALLSTINWGAILLVSAVNGNPPTDVVRLGLTTNPLYAIELAFMVPLFAVAGFRLLRGDTRGPLLATPLLILLVLLGLGLSWEAAGVAAGGGSFDAGQAMAGVVFAIVPALLLVPLGLRRGVSEMAPSASNREAGETQMSG
jgi:hypothetical protein